MAINVPALRSEIRKQRNIRQGRDQQNLEPVSSPNRGELYEINARHLDMGHSSQSRSGRLAAVYRVPVLGYVVRLGTGVFNLPRIINNLYVLQSQVANGQAAVNSLTSQNAQLREAVDVLKRANDSLSARTQADSSERVAAIAALNERELQISRLLEEVRSDVAAVREATFKSDLRFRTDLTSRSAELTGALKAESTKHAAQAKLTLEEVERLSAIVARILFQPKEMLKSNGDKSMVEINRGLAAEMTFPKGGPERARDVIVQMNEIAADIRHANSVSSPHIPADAMEVVEGREVSLRLELVEELVASLARHDDRASDGQSKWCPTGAEGQPLRDPRTELNFSFAASGVSRVNLIGSSLSAVSPLMFELTGFGDRVLFNSLRLDHSPGASDVGNVALMCELRDSIRKLDLGAQATVFGPVLEVLTKAERGLLYRWLRQTLSPRTRLAFQVGLAYWDEVEATKPAQSGSLLHQDGDATTVTHAVGVFASDLANRGFCVESCIVGPAKANGRTAHVGGLILIGGRDD